MKRTARHTYDAIGSAYDQANHVEVTRSFFRAVRPVLAHGGTVLDLGCATGLLTEHLAKGGRRVHGIDISPRMLRAARHRCRGFGKTVTFSRADLRTFALPLRSAAAFACGDVINHFHSTRDLARMFRRVRQHLQPGGAFVFDTLNRWCFENYWKDRTYHLQGPHGDLVMECDWNPSTNIGTALMITYERQPDGRYVREQSLLREHLYANAVLRRLLLGAGFDTVTASPWSPWPDQHREASTDRFLWTARVRGPTTQPRSPPSPRGRN